jgi:hypothetical protein
MIVFNYPIHAHCTKYIDLLMLKRFAWSVMSVWVCVHRNRYCLSAFARSNAGIVGSIALKAWMSGCAFILCLCCPVCRSRPCDGLITRPRCPAVCVKKVTKLKKKPGTNKALSSHWWMKMHTVAWLLGCWKASSHEKCIRCSVVFRPLAAQTSFNISISFCLWLFINLWFLILATLRYSVS